VGLAASLLLLLVARSVLQGEGSRPDGGEALDGSAVPVAPPPPTDHASGAAVKKRDEPTTATAPPSAQDRDSDTQVVHAVPVTEGSQASTTTGGPEDGESGTGPEIARPEPPRPPPVSTVIDEGCRQVRIGDARRGVDLLMAAHDRAPRDLQLQWCLADGYAKLGKYESALRYYSDLLAENPRHSKALRGAAQANEYLNRRAAAAALYERLLVQEPNSASAKAFFAGEAQRAAGQLRPTP